MSDKTPRTDETRELVLKNSHCGQDEAQGAWKWSRDLERENNEMRKLLKESLREVSNYDCETDAWVSKVYKFFKK